MKGTWVMAIAIIIGIIIALLTGAVNSTPRMLVGAVWYGLPVSWLFYLVVGPQYNPWVVNWAALIVDCVVWSGIIVAIVSIFRRR